MSGRLKSERAEFAMIPEWLLLAKGTQAVRVYGLLDRRANDEGVAWPGRASIAADLDLSVATVDRSIAELVESGAITIEKRTTDSGDPDTNLYTLTFTRPEGIPDSLRIGRRGSRKDGGTCKVGGSPKDDDLTRASKNLSPPNPPKGEGNEKESAFAEAVRAVFEHWVEARGKQRSKLTNDRRRKVEARLREGYTKDELCKAVDGVAFDPWPERAANDDLTYVCRSGTDVDKFIGFAESAATESSQAPPCPTCSGTGSVDGGECWDCRGCGFEVVG